MRGAYVIVLTLDVSIKLNVGRNCWKLKSGTYAYIGSGMVNLEKRVLRHFSSSKNLHWHIDYLTQFARPLFAVLIPSDRRLEEEISLSFQKFFECIEGFGASDLKVPSNLYRIHDFKKFSEILHSFLDTVEK